MLTMKLTTTYPQKTEALLSIAAEQSELDKVKKHVFAHFSKDLKVPGFRQGKVPHNLVEKYADASLLQSEFLEHAINELYPEATRLSNIRPVDEPAIEIKKYVPFSALEFTAKVPVIGKVKLADYKKIKLKPAQVNVTQGDVDEVIEALRTRSAKKTLVQRASKSGDEVVIDYKGVDNKGIAVNGAEGKDFPLVLGSKAFIPGFEDNLVGLKPSATKTFTITFPKDYAVKALSNRKVTFTVTIKSINSVDLPEVNQDFATSVGPVKTVEELRKSIESELEVEKNRQALLDYESKLVQEIASKSEVEIPDSLINEEVERLFKDLQQNLAYRGQTIQEFLDVEGKTEEDYKKTTLRERASERVKAGVVLAEIADLENISITPEELEMRLQALKAQYQDEKMQQELDKPENKREIVSRMLSEKTVATLSQFAQNTNTQK